MKHFTSIVILSYNTLDYLKMCIESIRAFTKAGCYELIIVENASSDGSAEWLRQQNDVIAIYNDSNAGFPAGCNQGMEIAKGSEILLLNSDVIVTPRWLDQMLAALYSDDRVGAVSCVTNCCSNQQAIEVPYNKDMDMMLDFAEQYNHSDPAKWIMHFTLVGFCYLFKRKIYDTLGGLDEAFSPGNFEDDDYSFRIMKAGYKLLLCRDTFIHHFGSSSFVKKKNKEEYKQMSEKYNNLILRNREYFCKKWGVVSDYKAYSSYMDNLDQYISKDAHVLVIGRNNLYDIYMSSGLFPGMSIEYATDQRLDYELARFDFCVYYSNISIYDALEQISSSYDMVIITDSIKEYSEDIRLQNIINRIATKSRIKLEAVL